MGLMSLVALPLSDVDRFMLASKAVYSVTCPKCLHDPGGPCQSMGGGNSAVVATHKVREARIADWTDAQLVEFAALVQVHRERRWTWSDLPDGYYVKSEAAAAPIPDKPAKQPTPKGVRLSEVQAEEIERAAHSGSGGISAPTAHFHGDAQHRQTVNALAAKGILREDGLTDDGYERWYWLTAFGWRVYREHRLVIRRLSDDEIDAGEASAVSREQDTTNTN